MRLLQQVVVSDYPQVAAQPSAAPMLEWLGAGMYYQRADRVWVHASSAAGSWRHVLWLKDSFEVGKRLEAGTGVVNARQSVLALLTRFGLDAKPYYEGISSEICQALAAEAERWRIPYTWGEVEEHRFLGRSRRILTFCWNLPIEG